MVCMTDRLKPPHLLLVTPYYLPEIAASVPLMVALAEGLSAIPMRVTVLTMVPSRGLMDQEQPGDGTKEGPRIIRLWNPFSRRKGVVNKLLEFVFFFLGMIGRALLLADVDAIFVSSSPPLAALPVAFLGRIKGVPVTYNLQDLFPESAAASGMMTKGGWAFRLCTRMERWSYALPKRIIAIDESFSVHIKALYPAAEVEVIPNWVDTKAMVEQPKSSNAFLKLLPRNAAFQVLYAGNLGYLQNLDLLIDAACLLRDYPEILFIFVGSGNQKGALLERVEKENLHNCIFMDFQPYPLLSHVFSACNLGIVPMRPGAGTSSIPSKTWNYFSCSKPVLACVEAESPFARLIATSGGGTVTSPADPHALAESILTYYRDANQCRTQGLAGRTFVVDHLAKEVAIRRYAQAMAPDLGLVLWKQS